MNDDDLDLMLKGPQPEESSDDFIANLVAGAATEQHDADQQGYISVPTEQLTPKQLQSKLVDETTDAIRRSSDALSRVLMDLESTPGDMQTMMGAAHLITAHSRLLDQLNKINQLNAKLNHDERMTLLKTSTAKEMNDDNISVKREQLMQTREELMRELGEE